MDKIKELTKGNPYKLIICFMFPLFIGKFFQQIYYFTDALIIGRAVGIKALATIGVCFPILFFVISFIFDSIQGFTIITAQKFGAKDYENVKKSFAASIVISFWLTIIITVLFAPLSKFLLIWMKTPVEILPEAAKYLYILFIGLFSTIYYNLFSNIIKALGNSKIPLYFLIFSVLMNIILDIIFVIFFGWGVEGAAWATVTAQIISTVSCGIYIFFKFPILHLKKTDFNINWKFYYEHLKIGIPMGLHMTVLSFGLIIIQYLLNTFGSIAIAAYTLATRVDQIFLQALMSLGATMSVFTAQNYGLKNYKRIKYSVKSAITIAGIISLSSILLIIFFGQNIISIFMTNIDNNVLQMSKLYLNITVVFFLFFGILLILRNTLQGMGKVIAPLISSIISLIIKIFLAFVFTHYYGFLGICVVTPLVWVIESTILSVCYKKALFKN